MADDIVERLRDFAARIGVWDLPPDRVLEGSDEQVAILREAADFIEGMRMGVASVIGLVESSVVCNISNTYETDFSKKTVNG